MQEPIPNTMHIEYEDFSSKWMFQKPSLASSLLKHVARIR